MSLQLTGSVAADDVQFILSTPDFAPEGVAAAGVPLFFNPRTMELLELPTKWMFYVALQRARTRSPNTWRSYAESLADWLRHCAANEWSLLEIGEGHLGAYRRHMLHSNTVNGAPHSASTINGRVNVVWRFYKWLHERGFIERYPFTTEEMHIQPRGQGLLAFAARKPRSRRQQTVPIRRRIPKALSRSDLDRLRKTIVSERDLLIIDWALVTGMRRFEILSLNVKDLPDISLVRQTAKVVMHLMVTKGGYPRDIPVPVALLDRTWRYINSERARIIREQKRRNVSWKVDAVFLSERGTRLSPKTLWRAFNTAVTSIGMKLRFHDLRHTFAIHRLRVLDREKRKNPELTYVPLLKLRDDLGHRDLSATQIYLHAMEHDTADIEHVLDTLLDDTADK